MKKLLNLLKEYEEEKAKTEGKMYEWRIEGEDIIGENLILGGDESINVCEDIICSKRYGFIKWLFDKNKIDWSKFHKYSFYKKDNKFIQYYDCQSLLMALSISDTPIDDLISYLK